MALRPSAGVRQRKRETGEKARKNMNIVTLRKYLHWVPSDVCGCPFQADRAPTVTEHSLFPNEECVPSFEREKERKKEIHRKLRSRERGYWDVATAGLLYAHV